MHPETLPDKPVLITLVTPCLNPGPWLETCIQSVLDQEKGDYELEYFVVDGGSTDGTAEIIARYEKDITWWCSEPDRGLSHAINKGLSRARGKYFNWLNADDFLKPGALDHLARAIQKTPEALFVGGYFTPVDAEGHILKRGSQRSPEMSPGKVDRKKALRKLRSLEQPGGLFQTAFLQQTGGADEKLHFTMDQDLLLKALLLGDTFLLDESFIYFRKHQRQLSAQYSPGRSRERLHILSNLSAMNSSGFLSPVDWQYMKESALLYAWNSHRKGGRPWSAFGTALQGLVDYSKTGSRRRWGSRLFRSFQTKPGG